MKLYGWREHKLPFTLSRRLFEHLWTPPILNYLVCVSGKVLHQVPKWKRLFVLICMSRARINSKLWQPRLSDHFNVVWELSVYPLSQPDLSHLAVCLLAGCEDISGADSRRAGKRAEPVPGAVLHLSPQPQWDHPQRVYGPSQTGTTREATFFSAGLLSSVEWSHLKRSLSCSVCLLRKILRPFAWPRSGGDWSSWPWAWPSTSAGPCSSAPTSTTCAAKPERPSTPGSPTSNTGWTKVSGHRAVVLLLKSFIGGLSNVSVCWFISPLPPRYLYWLFLSPPHTVPGIRISSTPLSSCPHVSDMTPQFISVLFKWYGFTTLHSTRSCF